jgi:GNAT superfamily N-acetyltransferase
MPPGRLPLCPWPAARRYTAPVMSCYFRPVDGQLWSLRSATAADAGWIADLKCRAMRPDLERLGLWDRDWAYRRFIGTFVPANTDVIVCDGRPVGAIAVRAEPDAQWIEHFYLEPAVHGQGIGGQVLRHVMATRRDARPFRLAIDRGSAARRLYERASFTHVYDDPNGVDEIFEAAGTTDGARPPQQPGTVV